ncbi:MAG: rhomboid family intramembrane serine protease [Planctomycetota bacterium]|jgi:rhomboid protease GluP|nr:rhomboid family intramembrane serine protease [Planctomycetota bacterium]
MADWYFRNRQTDSIKACPGCGNLVRKDQEYCPYCAKRLAPEKGVRGLVRQASAIPYLATKIVLGALVLFFILQFVTDLLLPPTERKDAFGGGFFSLLTSYPVTYRLLGAAIPYFVLEYGQVWRFFMSCLLHFGLIHILFNGYALWNLGRLVEKFWGMRQVYAIFIITGALGAVASFLWSAFVTKNLFVHAAGASGGICGLLGLLLGRFYRNRYHIGEFLGSQLVRWAVYLIVFGVAFGADNAAHIGGMLSGAALGYFLPPTAHSRKPRRDSTIWAALTILAGAVALVSLGFMLQFYFVALTELRSA